MNPKMSETNIPKENLEERKQLTPIVDSLRHDLSSEVVPVTEEKEEVNLTRNLRTIDKGNLLGGAPGRNSNKPNPERTRKAVREIYAKHPGIKTVITFETPGDYSGDPASINAEKEEWAKLGVTVIELRTEETDLLEFFKNEKNHKKIIEAFKALDKGTAFIHCTFGMHRAVAFTEIWRATRGINTKDAMNSNKDYNTSAGHIECRKQAQFIIKTFYDATQTKEQLQQKTSTSRTDMSAEVVPKTPDNLPVIEKPITHSAIDPENYYVTNLTEIEGNNGPNYRGGAPGRYTIIEDGKKMRIRTKENIERSVDKMFRDKKLHTVIFLERVNQIEKRRWLSHGVKVIELPANNFKNFAKKYPERMWEAFDAMNKQGGGAFVHCTYGSHRAVVFVELWRTSRGITDRSAALDRNTSFNRSQQETRKNAQTLIEYVKAEAKRRGISPASQDTIETTKEAPLTIQQTAEKVALIGDSIGVGISKAGIQNLFSKQHKVTAIRGNWTRKSGKTQSIERQLDTVDPSTTPYLVIQGGNNDLLNKIPPEKVVENLKFIYDKAISKGFKKVIVLTLPVHKEEKIRAKYAVNKNFEQKEIETNKLLEEMASRGEIEIYKLHDDYAPKDPNFDNISGDGVHFQSKGSKILAELIITEMRDRISGSQTTGALAGEVGVTLRTDGKDRPATTMVMDGKVIPIPGYEAPISAFSTTEHLSAESKQLQETLQKELEKISPTIREKDLETIKASTVKDLRFNVGLLNGDKEKVPEEMNRRLAQYTDTQSDGGLRINYMKFNELTGQDHEMGIGLGDIMPPQYTKIIVVTEGGYQRMGERGIVETSDGPRVGYRDTETGGYLATYTGDVIYVLDPPLTNSAKLAELLAQEKATRDKGEETYSESLSYGSSGGGYSSETLTETQIENLSSGELQENPNLKDRAINGLNKNIAKNRKFWDYSHISINGKNAQWQYDPSISEGANIYNYSKAVCQEHGMGGMISAVWGVISKETGGTFNPWTATNASSAAGLTQALSKKTWGSFIPRAKESKDPFVTEVMKGIHRKGQEFKCDYVGMRKGRKYYDRTAFDLETANISQEKDYLNYSRANPYLSVYHVIMGIKDNIKAYKQKSSITGVTDFNRLTVPDQLRLIYLSHHDGIAGGPAQLAFMRHLKNIGIDITNKEAVRAFVASNTPESEAALNILCKNQRNRIKHRATTSESGERKAFLRSWYGTCNGVVSEALGIKYTKTGLPTTRSESEMQQAKQQSPQQQPTQISMAGPDKIPLPKIDKTKFPGKTAILVLGNGPHPERNKFRARVGAEISLQMREAGLLPQLIFSGGTKTRKISEAQEQIDHLASIPKYRPLLTETENPVGREKLSGSTYENISNTIAHLREGGFQNVIVVSAEPGENHGRRGANNLRKRDKTMNITYWEPETPDINNNFIGPTNFAQPSEQNEPVQEVKSSVEEEKSEEEKLKLSTTELIQIFKSGNKEEIDKIIARHGYPSLEKIEEQLKGTPQGKFMENPEGVSNRIDGVDNQILLTFDICSDYSKEDTQNVVNFINNVTNKKPPVPVILFVTGNALNNQRIRDALTEAAKHPHISIQNHGFKHLPIGTAQGSKAPWGLKPTQNTKDAYYEMVKGAILTQSITGRKPKVFRASGLYMDTRGVKMANLLGFQVLGESVEYGEGRDPGKENTGEIVLRHAKKAKNIEFIDNVRARTQRGEIKPTLNPKLA